MRIEVIGELKTVSTMQNNLGPQRITTITQPRSHIANRMAPSHRVNRQFAVQRARSNMMSVGGRGNGRGRGGNRGNRGTAGLRGMNRGNARVNNRGNNSNNSQNNKTESKTEEQLDKELDSYLAK